MKLSSTAFPHKGFIPSKYTCDADNISPPLHITDVPKAAKSLVLIMDDPDIPDFVKEKFGIEVFDHWTLFNILPDTIEIKEHTEPGVKGKNGRGTLGYTGPCPPDREHRYFFRIFALNKLLYLKEGATKREVLDAIKELDIIAQAELIGRYERIKQ